MIRSLLNWEVSPVAATFTRCRGGGDISTQRDGGDWRCYLSLSDMWCMLLLCCDRRHFVVACLTRLGGDSGMVCSTSMGGGKNYIYSTGGGGAII